VKIERNTLILHSEIRKQVVCFGGIHNITYNSFLKNGAGDFEQPGPGLEPVSGAGGPGGQVREERGWKVEDACIPPRAKERLGSWGVGLRQVVAKLALLDTPPPPIRYTYTRTPLLTRAATPNITFAATEAAAAFAI